MDRLLGDEFRANQFTQNAQNNGYVTLLPDGGFFLSWGSDGQDGSARGAYARRFGVNGNPATDEFRVNQTTIGQQSNPWLRLLPDRRVLAVWTGSEDGSGRSVMGRLLDLDGNPLGDEFLINQVTTGDQTFDRFLMDAHGRSLVIWRSSDGNGFGVFARQLGPDAAFLGDEFRVNTTTLGDQREPFGAVASEGHFVIAWTSDGQDGDGSGVFAQRYEASGARVGVEFPVNLTTSGVQFAYGVSMAPDSSFVITWFGNGPGDGAGVFARRFDPNGNPAQEEQGLQQWIIYLDNNRNGRRDPGERLTTTDQNGNYSFTNLTPGSYVVAEEPQDGWVQTAPAGATYQVTVSSGQVVRDINFGNQQSNTPLENRPPSFTAIAPTNVNVGQLLRYLATATDPDHDPLTFDLVVKPTGMAVQPSIGLLVWVPTADQEGVHDVILRVHDGRGGIDLQSFQITVSRANSTPVITSTPRGPAIVNLPYQYQVRAQDADGGAITFSLGAYPAGMTIDANTGLVSWTPAANQVGSPYVEITASDNRGAATTQSFDLPTVATAPNDPPAITSVPRQSIRLGAMYLYQVVATDPNSDPLVYSLPIKPDGMMIDPNTGLVDWTPTAAELGSNNVKVQVDDGRGGFAFQTFTINVVTQATNHPPNIDSNPPFAATVDRLYAYNLKGSDPDGDPLVWSLDTAPAAMSIDPTLGMLRWMPTTDQLGAQAVVVRVLDGQGGFATQSFSIAVRAVNLPPGISSVPPTEAAVDVDYSYAVRATDPEADPLTFALTTNLAGMSIDPQSGLIRWIPVAGQVGPQNVAIRVDDGQGGFATQNYTVVVSATASNRPPVITSSPSFVATANTLYQYQVTATEPEGQSLLFSILAGLSDIQIDPVSGLVQWTPTAQQLGPHSVTVAAIDPQGAGGTQSFTLTVLDDNNPTITSNPVQVVTAGLPYRYDVRAGDPDGDPLTFSINCPLPTANCPLISGMTIDQLGRITWSPVIPDIGTHRIEVTVADDRGGSVTQSYDLLVRADSQTPRVNLFVSANPAEVGSPVTFVVSATDNVGVAAIGFTINGSPVPLDALGRITLIADPAGSYDVVAIASDAAGNTGLASTTLLVIDTSDATAPDVSISAPADNTVITAPVDVVGTVSDVNLLSYTLSVASLGSDDFTTFFSRSCSDLTSDPCPLPPVSGLLAKFDPSGLANDTYRLKLSATDAGGNESSTENVIHVAGDLKIGNFTLSFTDLTVPVSGIPITVARTYDSLNSGSRDELGFGWRLEFRDTDLRTSVPATSPEEQEIGVFNPFRDNARVYVTLPGGRREGFKFQAKPAPGFAGSFFGFKVPTFVPDAGVTSQLSVPETTLIRNDFGEYFGLVNGGTLAYNPADALNFGGIYFVTTKGGIAYEIDANSGDLVTISDSSGNSLSFSDAAIDSNRGPRVTFERDPQGRITAVVDPAGQKVRYAYDNRGDLVAVTDREQNVTQFLYAEPRRPHFLTEVIDPLGRMGVRTEYDSQGRLVKLIDADGNPVELVHDPDNSVETVKDALGNTTAFEYDLRGNVVREIDALGGVTMRTYDLANNMMSETDPLGNTTQFTYDADANVLTETDPMGNVTQFTYTKTRPGRFARLRGAQSVSLLVTTTDPLGNTTTNTYSDVNLTSTTDAMGHVTQFEYDSAGNQTSITDAASNITAFGYDSSGNLIRQTDPLGNETLFTYDANADQLTQTTTLTLCGAGFQPACPIGGPPVITRQLVTSTAYDGNGRPITVTDAEGNTTRTEYDKLGNQVATIDALGRRTEFVYDDRGQLVETRFADGTFTSVEYDAAGRRVASTDRAGRITRFVYDKLGRLTETIFPDETPTELTDNPRTRTEYNKAGQVITQIDELGHRTEFEYDDAGRQILVRDALGQETRNTYDAAGRSVSTTDALGRSTEFVYDSLGRQVETIFADTTSVSTTYDALGRSVAQTDQLGRTTEYEYDSLGRLVAVVDALTQRTEYGYDELGDLVTQSDANGHVTRYEYDGLGRRIATVLPLGERSTTAYDPAGNVASTTDFNGDSITFDYDTNNRLLGKHFPDGTSVGFTYTVTGQRATYTDAWGTTVWQYDERDRLVSRTEPDGRQISYTFGAAGNRTSVSVPSGTIDYSFDVLNRLETVTDPDGGVTRYHYDAVGNLVRTELPNGTVETRQYDAVNHLLFLENTAPNGSVISSYRYTLAPTGRRDAVVENDGRRVDYDYDLLDRLIEEMITASSAGNRTIRYDYDPVGNRLSRDDSREGVTAYTYDEDDRLLTETLTPLGAGLPTPPTIYTYDSNGNTLSRQSATDAVLYDWDLQNRLIAADTDGDGTDDVHYQYDADGIRVSSTAGVEEIRYLIDTSHPFQQVVEEYTPGGVIKVSYVHGLDLISQNRVGTSGKSFYHVDGLGSARALTNSSGIATDRYIFDAFGRTIGQVGSTGNVYLFAGEQRDLETGLDYLRARYLSVGAGRFYGRDSFDGFISEPLSRGRYLYAGSDPVNKFDPSGRFTLIELVATTLIEGILQSIGEITFGAVRIASTALFARALNPAFRAQENALLAIANGDDADLAFETYLLSSRNIAKAFQLYSMGLNAIDNTQSWTDVAVSLGDVARSWQEVSRRFSVPDGLTDELRVLKQQLGNFNSITRVRDIAAHANIARQALIAAKSELLVRTGGGEFVKSIFTAMEALDDNFRLICRLFLSIANRRPGLYDDQCNG